MEKPAKIAPAKGKLGILLPGMGAVSTTFMAGVELVRRGKSQPVGSLTQMGTIRLGKRTDARSPLIKKFVPLAELKDLTFGGWDIFKDNAYQSAANAGVLNPQDLEKVKTFLSTIKPMKAAFDHDFVKLIDGPNIKKGKNKYELALQIKEDIANFRKTSRVSRLVTCWCGSTETFVKAEDVHSTPEKFIEAMKSNHPAIAPSMLYAWASITSEVPFANGAKPDCGYSRHPEARARPQRPYLRKRLQDRSDADEDDPCARFQGTDAGPGRLVLHEYSWQPRR